MLRQNISARKELVAESDRLIKSYNDSIKVKDSEINILQNEVDTLVHYYGKMVRNAYKYRDPRVWYLYVFASDNLGQAFRRAGYFRNISAQIRSEADVIRSKQAELETQKGLLDVLKQDALAEKDSRVKELNNLRKDEKEADQLVQQLKNDKKKIESQIAQKRKEVDKLNKEIQKKIAEAQKSKSTPSGAKRDDSQDIKLSGEFANNKGKLPWPASGVVVGKFGKRYHPVFKNLELPSNEGIDIAAEKGAEVKCVFDGQVLDVFVMPTYGQCVLVQHGKTYFTFYCKLCNVAVSKGDSVKTGQTIGVVDQINGSSQMHFEVWKDKVPQNPSNWLR
jgi:septal ring factor EnvC (AmiA/AmiB activator)